jgi:polyphenol oxidase
VTTEGRYHVQVNIEKGRRLKSDFLSHNAAMSIIRPEIFLSNSEVLAGMSTKMGVGSNDGFGMNMSYKVGDDPVNVEKNRKRFYSRFGISENNLAVPLQCHSNNVLRIDSPGEYSDCDALITNAKLLALAVTVADCVPILLFDPMTKIIGAVHAGWRGTGEKIVQRTIEKMKAEYHTDPAHIHVFIGPSAGVCCYEVGGEVAVMFIDKTVPYKKKMFLDLKKENMDQLVQLGVFERNIEVSTSCTICEKELFHSFRRDGKKAGRMMAFICQM